ncbi:phage tail protein [Vagococcus fluvialis]|uniref:phage tail tube protein n=1 Tax=Vagococcus fluvialis TaxID=2738 RepID=UPI00288C7A04|nr:phage tail protein [Vagococcus fluvialis]MDT2781387.1 phage tail protein [Vagococcus fluvialis]
MARKKNALRLHEVADLDATDPKKVPTKFDPLAKWISEITDDTDETSEETGYYDGDGTPSTDVTSIAEKWTVTGMYDSEDPAQALVASKKRLIGEGRKLWHKITQTDGKVFLGIATASEIKAGTGEATSYEEFSCILNFDEIPKELP